MNEQMNAWTKKSPLQTVMGISIKPAFPKEWPISYRFSIFGLLRPFRGDEAARALLVLITMKLSHTQCKGDWVGLSGNAGVCFIWKYDHFDLVLIIKQFEMIKLDLICLSVTLTGKYRLLTHTHTHAHKHPRVHTVLSGGKRNLSCSRSGITGVQE